jgi:hypothetical protein
MPGSGHPAADPDPPRTSHLARVRLIERRNSRPYGIGDPARGAADPYIADCSLRRPPLGALSAVMGGNSSWPRNADAHQNRMIWVLLHIQRSGVVNMAGMTPNRACKCLAERLARDADFA